jgi:hypothetical protein
MPAHYRAVKTVPYEAESMNQVFDNTTVLKSYGGSYIFVEFVMGEALSEIALFIIF